MKKLLVFLILLSGSLVPFACSDNNSNKGAGPTLPSGGSGGTPTPVPITGAPGTPTTTPTFAVVPPAYKAEFPAASSPNGFYLAPANQLYVAEGDGVLAEMEIFDTTTGVVNPLSPWNLEDVAVNGSGATVLLNYPIGVAYTPLNAGFDYFVILDGTANGGASIYTGTGIGVADVNVGTQWGTLQMKSPKGFATDGNYFYVADTGNGYIEEFTPNSGPAPGPIHRWKGYSPNNFVKPTSVAIDPTGNIWVGDDGYNPALLSEFASGGVTWITQWQGVPGCVANGMAVTVDGSGNDLVYVSDIANQQVEEYDHNGNILRLWKDPHSPHEFQPFGPSCIQIDTANNQIIVGDQNNDTVEVFGP